jgi:hypothetical protein
LGPDQPFAVQMRNDGGISNEVMNRVIRELDLQQSRLEI